MAKTKPKSESRSSFKSEPRVDVLVLGEHPSTYLCAALLRGDAKLRVVHATIPEEKPVDRACLLNPAFFSLHKLLEPLKRKVELTAIYGAQFLADDPATRSEHRAKATMAHTVAYKDLRGAVMKIAVDAGAELVTPKQLEIHRLDEEGIDVTLGKGRIRPRVLVVGGKLAESQQKMLGMPDGWGLDVVRRYTFLNLKSAKWADLGSRPIIPMSLDLGRHLYWAWLLPHGRGAQLAVEQPIESLGRLRSGDLMRQWVDTLRKHGVLKPGGEVHLGDSEYMDLPLTGALVHEGVANRTLLIGPAGGFYSATGEDLYPNCWSALFAADTIKKALKETHLQDALQPYRQKWRTTLGDYLRGPQQNLRFLLPLVYRNQVMTQRLTESILLGKSLVR
jgi:flavin-dependent dehydrogenase